MNPNAPANQPEGSEDEKAVVLPKLGQALSDAQVDAFAQLALKNIHREYPNKTGDVLAGPEAVKSPKALRLAQQRARPLDAGEIAQGLSAARCL